MTELKTVFEYQMSVKASADEVYGVLADVPDSVSHFGGLEALEPCQDGYKWTLEKAGVGKLSLQLIYACRYMSDAPSRSVNWEPIPGIGTARVCGHWTIEPQGEGTRLSIHNELVLDVPVPRLLRKPAQKVLEKENGRMLKTYLQNLRTTFDGGNGRVR